MIAIITTKDLSCQHPKEDMEYQPEEEDTNTPKSLTCGICGMDLDPETQAPDWDEMGKEEQYEKDDE
tara:strand:+ start:1376 stop:1576 length:201 start_codon:yes stop_codon:yes gene_type:complete